MIWSPLREKKKRGTEQILEGHPVLMGMTWTQWRLRRSIHTEENQENQCHENPEGKGYVGIGDRQYQMLRRGQKGCKLRKDR